MSYPIGTNVSLMISAEDKAWLTRRAKEKQCTNAAFLRSLIAESLKSHTDFPELPKQKYDKRIAVVVTSFQKSEMIYREDTIANYIRKLLWMYRSQEPDFGKNGAKEGTVA